MLAAQGGFVLHGVIVEGNAGRVKAAMLAAQGGFVLHGFLNPPNEITAGLDILPAL